MLASIDSQLTSRVYSHQVARSLLKMQSDVVEKMVREGLLSHHDANDFFAAVSHDSQRVDQVLARTDVSAGGGDCKGEQNLKSHTSSTGSLRPTPPEEGELTSNVSRQCGYGSGDKASDEPSEDSIHDGMKNSIGQSLVGVVRGVTKKKKRRGGGEPYVAL